MTVRVGMEASSSASLTLAWHRGSEVSAVRGSKIQTVPRRILSLQPLPVHQSCRWQYRFFFYLYCYFFYPLIYWKCFFSILLLHQLELTHYCYVVSSSIACINHLFVIYLLIWYKSLYFSISSPHISHFWEKPRLGYSSSIFQIVDMKVVQQPFISFAVYVKHFIS